MWRPPPTGAFRHRVRFDRSALASDGMGGTVSTWVEYATTSAVLGPHKGGEEVRAQRLSGIEPFEIVIRSDHKTRLLTSDDRAVDARTGRVFNIKWIGDLEARDRYLVLTCEAGGLTDAG